MRYLSISFSLLLSVSTVAAAGQQVRAVDPEAAAALREAAERSPAVRGLLDQLERTNVIVHIQFCHDLPLGIGGTTRFVTSRGGVRFLRISLDRRLRGADRLAILGHELQHVWEIARVPAADAAAIERLLDAAGYRTRGRYFETTQALQVERRIREELQAEPVIELDHQHRRAGRTKAGAEVAKR